MSKKVVKLTREQLERVIKYEKTYRPIKPIGFLKEEVVNDKEILEEGWKDVVLATALLLGVGLTGQNKAQAQKALSNADMMKQVEAVLEDERLTKVADSLEAAGLENALEKIENNANKIENRFNDRALKITGVKGGLKIQHGKDVKTSTAGSYEALAKKLKAGYAITNISQDTIQKIVTEKFPNEPVIDSLQVIMDAGDLFVTGAYDLTSEAGSAIQDYLGQINSQDGVIIGVTIESSTDFERINMGNEKLAQLRANEIDSVLKQIGVDANLININTLPNNGPDVYTGLYDKYESGGMSAQEFKTERDSLRKETSEFRYVKIIIDAMKITNEAAEDSTVETVEDVIIYNFELAKVNPEQFVINANLNLEGSKTSKTKCSTDCPTWNKGKTSGADKGFTDFKHNPKMNK